MTEILLVRHAQASFGAEDYDRLSALGWQQARWLGEYFAERGARFERVVRGSLRRHAETLAGIAEGANGAIGPVQEDLRLDEYDSGALLRAWTRGAGIAAAADRRAHFRALREAMLAWTEGALEGAAHEPFDAFRARVLAALEDLRASGAARILVVTSGGPIATMLAEALGMSARALVDLNLQTRNTGISELRAGARALRCVSFNAVPHLDRPDRAGALTYA
jgi:broad specificity phosphatase PhoE